MNDLSDPQGANVIVAAVAWLQGALLGTVATTIAVIAVASIGYSMLTGRANWRYGATVIVGCFIVFGASSIVAGIRSTSAGEATTLDYPLAEAYAPPPPPPPIVIPELPPQQPPSAVDPFAGAGVRPR